MNYTFEDYQRLFDSYTDIVGWDDVPRSLRLFDIRFRLALDLKVDFEGGRARVRTDIVREAYQKLYGLVDLYNAYEAYMTYHLSVSEFSIRKSREKAEAKNKKFESFLEVTGANRVLSNLQDEICARVYSEKKFSKDYLIYINKLIEFSIEGRGTFLALLDIKKDIKKGRASRLVNIFSLIYAERNQFYHNGQAAKMGISYKHRIWLLDQYREAIIRLILNFICFQLEREIKIHVD